MVYEVAVDASRFVSPGVHSRPIFVLGSPRSATTVVSEGLLDLGWSGDREGHLLSLLAALVSKVDTHVSEHLAEGGQTAFTVDSFSFNGLTSGLIEYFESFMIARFGSRWFDKSPGPAMVGWSSTLAKIFPHARFIFCRRRGVDVIASAKRRFTDDLTTVENLCDDWVATMMAWLEVRETLGARAMELEFNALREAPEKTGRRLATFLGLSSTQGDTLAHHLRERRPEQSLANADPVPLSQMPWTEDQRRYVADRAAFCMRAFGYGFETPFEPDTIIHRLYYTRDPAVVDLSQLKYPALYKHLGRNRFLLHPAEPPTTRSTIVYRAVDASGMDVVSARVAVVNPRSAPVRCGFSVQAVGLTLASAETVCTHDAPSSLMLPLPKGVENVEITLWSEMADPDAINAYAWLNIEDLMLSSAP